MDVKYINFANYLRYLEVILFNHVILLYFKALINKL